MIPQVDEGPEYDWKLFSVSQNCVLFLFFGSLFLAVLLFSSCSICTRRIKNFFNFDDSSLLPRLEMLCGRKEGGEDDMK